MCCWAYDLHNTVKTKKLRRRYDHRINRDGTRETGGLLKVVPDQELVRKTNGYIVFSNN